jgi:hypothetical protein
LNLSSQGKVDRTILIDEPKEFFKRSKWTKCGRRWQVLLCELWNEFEIEVGALFEEPVVLRQYGTAVIGS